MATYIIRSTGSPKRPGSIRSASIDLPDQSTIGELLDHLLESTEIIGKREDYCGNSPAAMLRILVNGRNIRLLGEEKAVLSNGDQISILLPIAGGRL
jgi:molybdopterin converting factor small subunit